MIVVLVVAAGSGWESSALSVLDRPGDVVVLKRCVDVDDLLATATAGQAQVALVALDAPGLDDRAVDHLNHHGLATVVVGPPADVAGSTEMAADRAQRIGAAALVPEDELGTLLDVVRRHGTREDGSRSASTDHGGTADVVSQLGDAPIWAGAPGRVITVWGPAGAPGRTTVASALAAVVGLEDPVTLVDADPYGGALAQVLGILDEISGVLAASRAGSSGLSGAAAATVRRRLDQRLGVVTGLPRAERWPEVRRGAIDSLAGAARTWGHVVVDTGFSLEVDLVDRGMQPARNQMTFEALEAADDIVLVATPDPVGLARLARGLADLREIVGDQPVHVVINRMRPTLAWTERDVRTMVAGFAPQSPVAFLPEDRAAVDRALVTGRTLLEAAPDSALVSAVRAVCQDLIGPVATPRGRLSRRRGATSPRR